MALPIGLYSGIIASDDVTDHWSILGYDPVWKWA